MNPQDPTTTESDKRLRNIIKLSLASWCTEHRFVIHIQSDSILQSVLIMEENGKAFARAYWYNDNPAIILLDWLSVDVDSRNQGIGTTMQEIREKIGIKLGCTTAFLWVEAGSWMHEWYKRRGYQDNLKHRTEKNAIWMRKELI